jgi:hypothetical protein
MIKLSYRPGLRYTLREILSVDSDQRPRQPRTCAIQEETHPQSFLTLHRREPKLPPDVIQIDESRKLGFIEVCALLKARNSLFHAAAKTRADFETLMMNDFRDHTFSCALESRN